MPIRNNKIKCLLLFLKPIPFHYLVSRYQLMPKTPPFREHISHPLTFRVVSRHNLSPDFNYLLISNARMFAAKFHDPPSPFSASEFSAIGLIGKVYLNTIEAYLQDYSPLFFCDLDEMLASQLSSTSCNEVITIFLNSFPTLSVYQSRAAIANYSFSSKAIKPMRHALYK